MRTKDMTVGNPMKLILSFAIPLFIGNIFQQVYNLVDTMIAGYNLGDAAIAAIGATSSIYNLIIYFASGLNSGYAIRVTQCFGAHDREQFRKSVAAMFVLNALGAAILTALTMGAVRPLMVFLNTPDAIFEDAYHYIAIICAGMAATLMYNMFASLLRAMGNSRTPLYFLIFSSAVNLSMDCLFIMVLHMGVMGAALATVIAQVLSAALCGGYLWKHYREYLPKREHFRLEKALLAEMLSTGISMGLMQCIFSIGSVILQRAINGLGQVAGEGLIAAHTSARRIIDIMMMPIGTIGSATSTFVSQNWGAGKLDRVRTAFRKSLLTSACYAAAAAGIVYLFGAAFVRGMTGTTDEAVLANAVMNLRINFAFYPALGVLVCLRMSMQAMGQKIAPLFASSLELIIKAAFSLWIIPSHGYVSASLTEPLTWLVCALLLGGIFLMTRRKNYTRCRVPLAVKGCAA